MVAALIAELPEVPVDAPVANDVLVPNRLPVGGVFEIAADKAHRHGWRVRQKADHTTVTDITHARARGKKAAHFVLRGEHHPLVHSACFVAHLGGTVEAMREALGADAFETTIPTHSLVAAGETVRLGPTRDLEPWVDDFEAFGEFDLDGFRLYFYSHQDRPNGGRVNITRSLTLRNKRTARTARDWARKNVSRIPELGRDGVYQALAAIGVHAE